MESVKGLKKLITVLEKLPKELDGDVEAVLEANAQEIELEAKRLCRKDDGYLARSIATSVPISDKGNKKSRVITVNAPYGPYVEFGTGNLVKIPKGLESLAIQFKGKGIREVNLKPRPFLFPAFFKGRRRFTRDLQDLLDNTFGKI